LKLVPKPPHSSSAVHKARISRRVETTFGKYVWLKIT
jgi:hypothetical protein